VSATWDVCIHEASHAIVDTILGAGVVEVWVDGHMGRCKPRGKVSASACLSGFAAEWKIKYPGQEPTAADFHRNRRLGDISMAVERIGDDPARLLACWRQARALVDQNWDAIERVAEVLQRRGRISGAVVEACWRGVSFAA
jgi:hypothetical protein